MIQMMHRKQKKKHVDLYLRAVKRVAPLPCKERKLLLESLETEIEYFLEKNPSACTFDDIESLFGSPENVVASYLETLELDEDLRTVKARRARVRMVVCILAAVLLLVTAWLWIVHTRVPERVTETIVVYQYN